MSKGREHSADYLRALFHGEGFPQYGDDFWVSLHTGAPANQSDAEATYKGYGRVSVPRTSENWSVDGISATNLTEMIFPPKLGEGKIDISHIGLGTDSLGSGKIIRVLMLRDAAALWIGRRAVIAPGQIKFSEV
jgi:hypothetical protein